MTKKEVNEEIKNLKIEDYAKDLEGACNICKKANKCKDHTKLCFKKQYLFAFCKPIYKKRLLKGVK